MQSDLVKTQRCHWATINEAGTLFGLKFLWGVHKLLGRRAVSVLLLPAVIYFVVCRPLARKASLDFLKTHAQVYPEKWQTKPNLWHTAKHFREFAETVVDKLLAWYIDIDVENFDIKNPEIIDDIMRDDRGQLIIGTHMGNLEYCRGFMQRYHEKKINILIHDKHSANYAKMMHALNPDARLNIFQVQEFDLDVMLQLKQKIDNGEWVFIAGDRVPLTGLERTVTVNFFDRPAPIPIGPYMLAKTLGCPVKLMFAYKDYSSKQEKVYFEVVPFSEKIEFSRDNRTEVFHSLAQKFVDELEKHCAKVPFQWFNFYPYWIEK